jgi:hypothetical protein
MIKLACHAARLSRRRFGFNYKVPSAYFRKLRDAGRMLTAGRIVRVVHDALKGTFEVFEGYAE